MIKNTISLVLFVFLSIVCNSQFTFQHIFENPFHQNIGNIIETNNGDIIFPIITVNPPESKIMKMDKEGNIVDSVVISDVQNVIFTVYKYNDDFFFATGFWAVDNKFKFFFWIRKYDYNFQLLKELTIPISGYSNLMCNPIMVNSKNNMVIAFSSDSTSSTSNLNLLEVDQNCNIIKYKKYTAQAFSYPHDIIQKDSLYFVFFSGFVVKKVFMCLVYKLDSLFNILNVYNLPPVFIRDCNNANWINDSTIVLTGKIHNDITHLWETKIIKMKVDTCLYPLKDTLFARHDSNNLIGWKKNLDFVDVNNIYLGSCADKGDGDYFSEYYSRLVLCKLDSALKLKWIKDYGGDAHYALISIKATQDGGCVMAAARYDYKTQLNEESDPFIIKVDSLGFLSWIYNLPDDFIKLTVYPNPGSNEMTVNNPPTHTKILLYDISGKLQKEQNLDVNNTINTEDLKAGIYFYQVIDNKGKVLAKGKWVKVDK